MRFVFRILTAAITHHSSCAKVAPLTRPSTPTLASALCVAFPDSQTSFSPLRASNALRAREVATAPQRQRQRWNSGATNTAAPDRGVCAHSHGLRTLIAGPRQTSLAALSGQLAGRNPSVLARNGENDVWGSGNATHSALANVGVEGRVNGATFAQDE